MSTDPTLALLYDFIENPSLEPLYGLGPTMTYVRNSNATRINSKGFVEDVPFNTPRFDHVFGTGEPLGLLSEATKVNQCLWSTDLSNAVWVASNMSKGSDVVLDPQNKLANAVRLTATAANATLLQTVTNIAAPFVFAGWIRRVSGSGDIDLTADGVANWNTVTVTDEWTRVQVARSSVTNPEFGIRIVTDGDEIDFWGGQLETQTLVASSTIHTTTVQQQRSRDEIQTNDVDWYNPLAGTFYVTGAHYDDGSDSSLCSVSDAGNLADAYILLLDTPSDNAWAFHGTTTGDDGFVASTQTLGANLDHGLAAAHAANDLVLYSNGLAGIPDTAMTVPASVAYTRFTIGANSAVANAWKGHIRELRFYNVRKDDNFVSHLSLGEIPYDLADPVITGAKISRVPDGLSRDLQDVPSPLGGVISGM